jgi:exosortase
MKGVSPVEAGPADFSALGRQPLVACALILLLPLLVLAVVLLAPQWRHNPDLSHGLFTPFVFILLLREARRLPGCRLPGRAFGGLLFVFSAVAGAGLVLLAALFAAALGWSHALVQFVFVAGVCGLLASAGLVCALPQVRLLPLNWPAATAILVWLLSAPIPPGTYTRLTLALQDFVTGGVLASLQWLGVAALREGNVINLAHVSVGVEEACSGIRSLVSCFFAAVLLSALVSRRWSARLVLLLAAGPIAIGMNFVRSFALTLLASRGIEIRGAWHDLTGFGILAVTALLLALAASVLEKFNRPKPRMPGRHGVVEEALHSAGPDPSTSGVSPTTDERNIRGGGAIPREDLPGEPRATSAAARPQLGFLILVLGATTLLLGVLHLKTRAHPRGQAPTVAIDTLLPSQFDGWETVTNEELHTFSAQLQTDFLSQRTYVRNTFRGPVQITVYLAYWPAGQASVSLVASHTPQACWPGAGWVEKRGANTRVVLESGGTRLPAAEYRGFELGGFPQNVWYWHLFGGEVIHPDATPSLGQLLSLAWHYGFRDEAPQLFIRISSNRPWQEIADEPLVMELISRLGRAGL